MVCILDSLCYANSVKTFFRARPSSRLFKINSVAMSGSDKARKGLGKGGTKCYLRVPKTRSHKPAVHHLGSPVETHVWCARGRRLEVPPPGEHTQGTPVTSAGVAGAPGSWAHTPCGFSGKADVVPSG